MVNFTGENEEAKDHDGRVAKIEEGRSAAFNVQLSEEVVDAVAGQVEGREPAGEEAAPPPVIVLEKNRLIKVKLIMCTYVVQRFIVLPLPCLNVIYYGMRSSLFIFVNISSCILPVIMEKDKNALVSTHETQHTLKFNTFFNNSQD